MNRRSFISATAATVFLSALPVTLIGCSSTTIADLVQTLGNSASQIAALEGNTSLASKLLTDTAAAVTAIDNWKAGTPSQDIIQVLNIVEDDLNLFPLTSAYIPLIDLAIGTVEGIIAILAPSAAPTAPTPAAKVQHRTVHLPYSPPNTAAKYRKRFNAIVDVHPEWKIAKLQ